MIVTNETTVTVQQPRSRRPSATLMAGLSLLVRRRMWRDRGLLFGSAVIVALATLMTYAGPQLVLATIDAGARDTVANAGPAANIVVRFPVGNASGDNVVSVPGTPPQEFGADSAGIVTNVPERLRNVVFLDSTWVATPAISVSEISTAAQRRIADEDDQEPETERRAGDQLIFIMTDGAEVHVVEGRTPTDSYQTIVTEYDNEADIPRDELGPDAVITTTLSSTYIVTEQAGPVEIALHPEVARVLEIGVGDLLTVTSALGVTAGIEVVGLVEPVDPDDDVWTRFREAHTPTTANNPAAPPLRRAMVMVGPEALAAVTDRLATPASGNVVLGVDSDEITLARINPFTQAVDELRRTPATLLPNRQVSVSVATGFDDALQSYPPRARAALAQMSVVVAGVIAVAAVVIALMAQLLLTRRRHDIALERARGASIGSVGLRLATEASIITAMGLAAGYVLASTVADGVQWSNGAALGVAAVSILAAPVLGMNHARGTWAGKREAANRQDRARARKRAAARRLTLDALAVVLGILAVVTLRNRGVLQTQTEGIDLFLAAAPVLLALAVVVIVIRSYPVPMAIVQAVAKRTRGVTGAISLAKAREPIPGLPLLALTLALAVAVGGGLLVGTVRGGQEQASWERVGAQARIDAPVDEFVLTDLDQDGVTLAPLYVRQGARITLGSNFADTTVVAITPTYPEVIEESGMVDATEFRNLLAASQAWQPGDGVPTLASDELTELAFTSRNSVFLGRSYVGLEFLGPVTQAPEGWLTEGPYIVVAWEVLEQMPTDEPLALNTLLVGGPRAIDVVAESPVVDQSTVITRASWLGLMRDSALIGGVETMMTIAVLAVGVLAAVALLVTVLRGVRSRGQALVMLRTQGMRNRYGWWLALTELAPLTIAAVVGGALAGLAMVAVLGSTLGLEVLSGGIAAPTLDINPTFVAAVGGAVAALLFAAIAAEVATHRRHKLSDVLRQGQSGEGA